MPTSSERLAFARELQAAARRRRLAIRLISDRPEEWRLGPLTVVVDRRKGTAQLRYARQAIGRGLACQAEAVMNAWEAGLARLAERSLAPADLLRALSGAYAAVRAKTKIDRVPVEALHAELSRRAGGRYPRAQLAWDLARLRRERRLVAAGRLRIDLGVATGFATARKRSVLWVEDESGAGQYYQTFRMIEA